ncbi:MAG: hypothetical protein Q8L66_06295 [Caulobacter sp.]|nr:hypothetical protein [Caulobacter sp.]
MTASHAPDRLADLASKVPAVTLSFWVIKILATTLGETGGDLLSMTLNLGYALSTGIFMVVFVVAVITQIRMRRFHPFVYWGVILATTLAGTTLSDYLDRTAGLGYLAGSALLISLLIATLAAWRLTLGSISSDHISDPKAEAFYWVTILFSNTLGTALGDFLADSSGLGYQGGALLIAGLLAVVAIAYFRSNASRVLLFWLAFVLTRPLGATVGDLLTKTHEKGGLALGTVVASLTIGVVLAALIVVSHRRRPARSPAAPL